MTLEFSTDINRMDVDLIHRELTTSYWSPGIPRVTVLRAMENSLCFSAFQDDRMVAFARVITDRAAFAWLADVFVLPEIRGIGVGKKLIAHILQHADLQGLRRFMLGTRDAHGLYRQFGFEPIENPALLMQIFKPDIYRTEKVES
jgi:GNAT superfamily N-acetyltransferase